LSLTLYSLRNVRDIGVNSKCSLWWDDQVRGLKRKKLILCIEGQNLKRSEVFYRSVSEFQIKDSVHPTMTEKQAKSGGGFAVFVLTLTLDEITCEPPRRSKQHQTRPLGLHFLPGHSFPGIEPDPQNLACLYRRRFNLPCRPPPASVGSSILVASISGVLYIGARMAYLSQVQDIP